jgi:hypothetical protein
MAVTLVCDEKISPEDLTVERPPETFAKKRECVSAPRRAVISQLVAATDHL